MAASNKLPAFLDGARLVIKVDEQKIAFCEALSFSDNMASQMTMGIGSYSPHTNEPLIYSSQASLRVLRYTSAALGGTKSGKEIPSMKANMDAVSKNGKSNRNTDGNSMMHYNAFSPVKMLLESTFDIEVYTRTSDVGGVSSAPTYVMKDCLITDLSIRFNVGSLVSEDISILCRMIQDNDERITKT